MSLSEEYRRQLIRMHRGKRSWGYSKKPKQVEHIIENIGFVPKSVIDYGCGKGGLGKTFLKMYPDIEEWNNWDPGVKKYADDSFKKKSELLVSLDVLEHIEPDHVKRTLREISKLFTKKAYLKIANYPAKAILPDGRNAHLIQKGPNWWHQQCYKWCKNVDVMDVNRIWGKVHNSNRTQSITLILKKRKVKNELA